MAEIAAPRRTPRDGTEFRAERNRGGRGQPDALVKVLQTPSIKFESRPGHVGNLKASPRRDRHSGQARIAISTTRLNCLRVSFRVAPPKDCTASPWQTVYTYRAR